MIQTSEFDMIKSEIQFQLINQHLVLEKPANVVPSKMVQLKFLPTRTPGIGGLQGVVLYALPELDGAIDAVPLGGLSQGGDIDARWER